jgi:hypothetical protein
MKTSLKLKIYLFQEYLGLTELSTGIQKNHRQASFFTSNLVTLSL